MLNLKKIIKIKNNNTENKKTFISNIINSSAPNIDFYLMVIFSTIITTLGLISNNVPLIIAGMIVAPLLSPILAISLGITILNLKIIWRSIKIVFVAVLFSLIFSTLTGAIFNIKINQINYLNSVEISWLSLAISFVAGIIASYSWTRENIKDYLSGVAIAVTIIPPLSLLGLLIYNFNTDLIIKDLLFFLLNIAGILLGSILVFLFMNFYKIKKTIDKNIEKEIKKEESDVNNINI
jgi:uncharacterized hydrophobic protein (TIGR00271 family)